MRTRENANKSVPIPSFLNLVRRWIGNSFSRRFLLWHVVHMSLRHSSLFLFNFYLASFFFHSSPFPACPSMAFVSLPLCARSACLKRIQQKSINSLRLRFLTSQITHTHSDFHTNFWTVAYLRGSLSWWMSAESGHDFVRHPTLVLEREVWLTE